MGTHSATCAESREIPQVQGQGQLVVDAGIGFWQNSSYRVVWTYTLHFREAASVTTTTAPPQTSNHHHHKQPPPKTTNHKPPPKTTHTNTNTNTNKYKHNHRHHGHGTRTPDSSGGFIPGIMKAFPADKVSSCKQQAMASRSAERASTTAGGCSRTTIRDDNMKRTRCNDVSLPSAIHRWLPLRRGRRRHGGAKMGQSLDAKPR